VRRTVPPSAEIEEQIDALLAVGVGENPREALTELARLGARLIIQRAVEDEFDAWLGRARYERRAEAPPGLRNGFRPRRVQTAEGELSVQIPQVREAAEPFVSKLFPRGTKLLRTEPLRAMVIGAFVRGLSMRDVESLCEQAGLGKLSKSTAARICSELRDRFEAFGRRDLYDIHLAALFLDATFLAVRRDGPKEGVLVAWGFTEDGERVLLAVMLGMREAHEDWLALGRDLIARGLGAPLLIVADGVLSDEVCVVGVTDTALGAGKGHPCLRRNPESGGMSRLVPPRTRVLLSRPAIGSRGCCLRTRSRTR
jgi:putative transposase